MVLPLAFLWTGGPRGKPGPYIARRAADSSPFREGSPIGDPCHHRGCPGQTLREPSTDSACIPRWGQRAERAPRTRSPLLGSSSACERRPRVSSARICRLRRSRWQVACACWAPASLQVSDGPQHDPEVERLLRRQSGGSFLLRQLAVMTIPSEVKSHCLQPLAARIRWGSSRATRIPIRGRYQVGRQPGRNHAAVLPAAGLAKGSVLSTLAPKLQTMWGQKEGEGMTDRRGAA